MFKLGQFFFEFVLKTKDLKNPVQNNITYIT